MAVAVGAVCRSPATRHAAWVAVLLKLVAPPLITLPLAVVPAGWVADWPVPTGAAEAVGGYLLWAWLAGSAGWFAWQGRRVARFRRCVRAATPAPTEMTAAAARLAAELGITRVPPVGLAGGIGSPMLWGFCRRAVVLFPAELLLRLTREARDSLLAHELAHYRRRDHWVRAVEFAVSGLFWWHPAVWLARRRIEMAEEECCDAWVVGGLRVSPRLYAGALLATVDFAAERRRPCIPLGASAAGRSARLLRRRLVAIIHPQWPCAARGGLPARLLVIAALVTQPALRVVPDTAPGDPTTTAPVLVPTTPGLVPYSPPPVRIAEPPAWATASAGGLTILARDREVVVRRPAGTARALGPGRPIAAAASPTTPRLATAGPGRRVRVWDRDGSPLAEAETPADARSLCYTPDGSALLVLDAAGAITIFEPNTLAVVAQWRVGREANGIACSPDGTLVAVAVGSWLGEAGAVELWSIPGRTLLRTLAVSAPVGAARFSPDGATLVAGGWSGRTAWFALPSGSLVAERLLPKSLVASAAFSPDADSLPVEPPPEPGPAPLLLSPRPPCRTPAGPQSRSSDPLPRRSPVMVGCLILTLFAQVEPDDGLAKTMAPIYAAEAREYTIAVASAPDKPLELKKEPVFEWSNPVRSGVQQGTVYLWLRGDGRPAAVGNFFSEPEDWLKGRKVMHEFHALDAERLVVARPKEAMNEWKPEAGLARKPLDGAPAPATSAGARLLQMKRLAQEFTGHETDADGNRLELRLLPAPLYRYPVAKEGVTDGALFTLVSTAGTDPEVLLLIEATATGWQYALCRYSDRNLFVKRNDKDIWSLLRSDTNTFLHDPQHLFRVYPDKVVGLDGRLLARCKATEEKWWGEFFVVPPKSPN